MVDSGSKILPRSYGPHNDFARARPVRVFVCLFFGVTCVCMCVCVFIFWRNVCDVVRSKKTLAADESGYPFRNDDAANQQQLI